MALVCTTTMLSVFEAISTLPSSTSIVCSFSSRKRFVSGWAIRRRLRSLHTQFAAAAGRYCGNVYAFERQTIGTALKCTSNGGAAALPVLCKQEARSQCEHVHCLYFCSGAVTTKCAIPFGISACGWRSKMLCQIGLKPHCHNLMFAGSGMVVDY